MLFRSSQPSLLAAMPCKVFLAALAADVLFLVTGCILLGFSLVVRNQMNNAPQDGPEAIRHLLYQRFPLTAAMVNAVFIFAASIFTIPGLMSPMRFLLKFGGYFVTICGLFTLVIGVYLWIMTLRIKASFFPTYVEQDPAVQSLIQVSVRQPPPSLPPCPCTPRRERGARK